ncbi:hypothetical protein OG562_05460 [Streptomyces sp. NBC_01275]|uniref:hypothetical protein n=1 Tax=Streptomyces sp. NBC_01275 TaxID=2903807 RepID=UPI00225850AE|nr:hypothetical protein [Streptomyces sp. NBC_01275]MCX4760425.1 hypothetical protein [Streptomyces sp. NBC_01275]
MWPGERPPTGGPNPQLPQNSQHSPSSQGAQNPQPAQPNPYLQPGFQQPNPYGQQPAAPWNAPTVTAAPPPGDSGGGRSKVVAITAAGAVLAAAVVTGAVLLRGGDDEPGPAPTPVAASTSASATANPRDAATGQPTVAGWKVVVNPDLGVAFDVPADWAVKSTGWVSYVADDDDPEDTPLVAMKAPAFLKEEWCAADDDRDGENAYTSLASAGTRGNNGAKSTEEIAKADSAAWVYGDYTQPDHAKVTTGPATSYTTASGLTGSVATSRSSGVEEVAEKGKCDTDGKATTFAFKTPDGDLASWSFVGVKGVTDEVPDATIRKIMDTVRVFQPAGS